MTDLRSRIIDQGRWLAVCITDDPVPDITIERFADAVLAVLAPELAALKAAVKMRRPLRSPMHYIVSAAVTEFDRAMEEVDVGAVSRLGSVPGREET